MGAFVLLLMGSSTFLQRIASSSRRTLLISPATGHVLSSQPEPVFASTPEPLPPAALRGSSPELTLVQEQRTRAAAADIKKQFRQIERRNTRVLYVAESTADIPSSSVTARVTRPSPEDLIEAESAIGNGLAGEEVMVGNAAEKLAREDWKSFVDFRGPSRLVQVHRDPSGRVSYLQVDFEEPTTISVNEVTGNLTIKGGGMSTSKPEHENERYDYLLKHADVPAD